MASYLVHKHDLADSIAATYVYLLPEHHPTFCADSDPSRPMSQISTLSDFLAVVNLFCATRLSGQRTSARNIYPLTLVCLCSSEYRKEIEDILRFSTGLWC